MSFEESQIRGLADIYNKYLDNPGVFVEVGANDGKSYSNTHDLIPMGWKGVYIEPVRKLMNKCRINHSGNDVAFLEVACSDHNGTLDIYELPDLYTANKDIIREKKKYETVPCIVLNDLFRLFSIFNIKIDLLIIDVEFHEKEVLQGFNKKYRPKMVIIEAHEKHTNKEFSLNAEFINEYFSDYEKIYSDNINNIYVDKHSISTS